MSQLFTDGEQLIIENIFLSDTATLPGTITVGLYDSSDALGDEAVPGDITTEPSGAAYSRQTLTLDSTDFTSEQAGDNDWQAVGSQIAFDLSDDNPGDETVVVDKYFVIYNDGTEKMFFDGDLSREYPLDLVDTLNVERVGLNQE